jgi:hypothetical protein
MYNGIDEGNLIIVHFFDIYFICQKTIYRSHKGLLNLESHTFLIVDKGVCDYDFDSRL